MEELEVNWDFQGPGFTELEVCQNWIFGMYSSLGTADFRNCLFRELEFVRRVFMKPASFIVDGNFQVGLCRNWILLIGIPSKLNLFDILINFGFPS